MVSDGGVRQWRLFLPRLNPCSNGIWSLTVHSSAARTEPSCLNPCSNGIWSLTTERPSVVSSAAVLILVLMEYGLWRPLRGLSMAAWDTVLILVLMEYGLWPRPDKLRTRCWTVLILVLMEYGLWRRAPVSARALKRLNPCSNGIWSLTDLRTPSDRIRLWS